ncbi:MAG TPA: molybdate ABC transporter substrate-binding protein [Candidatus Acidoferrales bacterium]|nr:molybdate ABC transporter substrate-binding protein [Candidatus Acidoferrales bacterium]
MMRLAGKVFLIELLALIAVNGIFANRCTLAEPASEITVSAAISLKDVLYEIAQAFREQDPSTIVRFNLGASGSLQFQIEQGAPVDIFISAAPKQMDALESEGQLLPHTRKNLVENQIVLIVPKGNSEIANFQDLTKPRVKLIAIGEPNAVPAGKYAQEILTHFGIYDELKPKFVEAQNVRQVLTFVETGNADAGIVYRTDATTSNKVAVIATAPDDSHSPVIYPVAVIKRSQDISKAKAFVNFLLGSKASEVFRKYGFIPASR